MTVVPQGNGGAGVPAPAGGGTGTGNLYDVLELVLDRGLVIDAFVRVSLVGIEILKIDARVVVASVDTYLRFAEACNRLDLEASGKAPAQLTDLVQGSVEEGAGGRSKGALSGAAEAVTDATEGRGGDEGEGKDEADERERTREKRRERPERGSARRSARTREE